MNLQELLKTFELAEDQIKQINQSVDKVIDGKIATKENELNELQEKYSTLETEYKPLKAGARSKHIKSLIGDKVASDAIDDAITLAQITDEDDDESISSKIQSTIENRKWLQPDSGIAPESIKQEKATVVKADEGSLFV